MISDEEYLAWLRTDVPKVLIAEMDSYDTVAAEVVTHYISNKGYNTRWSAGVEHRAYPDYIKGVPSTRRTLGSGRPTRGEMIIDNTGGERDEWLTRYKWDGRKVRLLYGAPSWEYADFRQVFIGVIKSRHARGVNELVYKLREPEDFLDQPIQSDTISTGPNAGDYVPISYGECFNVSPTLINGATHVYQLSDVEIGAVTLVKDNGKGPVAHTADLVAGTITLTGSPVGNITVDCSGAKVGGTVLAKAGEIINHIITTRTDLPAEYYDAAAFTALDAQIPWHHNLYINSSMTARQAVDRILASIGAKLSRTEAGAITVVRLAEPAAVADVTIGQDDFKVDTFSVSSSELPWKRARLGFRRNYTVQESLDTLVTEDERALLGREHSIVEQSNAVTGIHPLAIEPELIATTLTLQADAEAFLAQLMQLHAVERHAFELLVYAVLYQFPLGSTICLIHDRFGFDGGLNCLVHDTDSVFTSGKARLTLWR